MSPSTADFSQILELQEFKRLYEEQEEKHKRQFIFSSHNANIPVLGDAELIVGLTPTAVSTSQVPLTSTCASTVTKPSTTAQVDSSQAHWHAPAARPG